MKLDQILEIASSKVSQTAATETKPPQQERNQHKDDATRTQKRAGKHWMKRLIGLAGVHDEAFGGDSCTRTGEGEHVTRHTSHVTRHTSHVTRHTSHIPHPPSHVRIQHAQRRLDPLVCLLHHLVCETVLTIGQNDEFGGFACDV